MCLLFLSSRADELACQSGVWEGQGLGYGQAWQVVTANRSTGVAYINTTNRPMAVSIYFYGTVPNSHAYAYLHVGGIYATAGHVAGGVTDYTMYGIVPPGASYRVTTSGAIAIGGSGWTELR